MSQIGTYVVTEPTKFLYNGFETASWWRETLVPAGEYPVMHMNDRGMHHITVKLPGVVTGQYFASRYDKNGVGQPNTHLVWLRGYALARALLESDPHCPPVKLSPEWAAEWVHFDYEGEKHVTTQLVNKTTGEKIS